MPRETSVTTTSRGPPAEALETASSAGSRRERVGEPARGEHEQRDRAEPEEAARSHRTRSVKGAVDDAAAVWNWRKSRQVPATGSSTPTFSWPGPAGRPTTFAPPRMLVQPGVDGPADVGVEVVERALPEEDRVRERAEPRGGRRRPPLRVGDRAPSA